MPRAGSGLLLAVLCLVGGTACAEVRVGAVRRTITPELTAGPVWLAGFGQDRRAGEIHDDLWVRCLALADGSRQAERPIRTPVSNSIFRKASEAGLLDSGRRLAADGTIETVVGLLRLWRRSQPLVEAALVPGELYPELSRGGIQRLAGADFPDATFEPPIKPMLRAPFGWLIGLANDEIGYILPRAEWDEKPPWLNHAPRRWYGEIDSVGRKPPRTLQPFWRS